MDSLSKKIVARKMVYGIVVVTFACAFLFFPGCGREKAAAPEHPAVEVTAVTVTNKDTPVSFEFVGQTESSRQVEIRARVNGFLDKRAYEEGTLVKAGAVMFQMEKSPFEATLQQAKGELSMQEARLAQAKANLARIKPLAAKNAISKKDLDDALSNEQVAQAAVFAAQGKVQEAELNLGYTTIKSPVTGISSRAKKQEGSYVSSGPDGLLTYVAQLDPIWVNFSISENEILRLHDQEEKGLVKFPRDKDLFIEVILANGFVFPHKGRVNFAEPNLNIETGTFLVRAAVKNPKGALRPGQFVRVRILGAVRPRAVVIPQRAVMQGAKGHFVWVVKEGKAEFRSVEVGDWFGDDWFITNGLKVGEQVAVDGAIKLAPGAPVKIVQAGAQGGGSKVQAEAKPAPSSTEGKTTKTPAKK
jgi:membrane fusion protein (multidrug efflux system)